MSVHKFTVKGEKEEPRIQTKLRTKNGSIPPEFVAVKGISYSLAYSTEGFRG
jgi:hypothetical protein